MIDKLPVIRILQLNVGRNWEAHEAALQIAFENNCHAILIQEPWIFADRSRRLSKHHPSYHLFAPVENWESRPRTLTYIRKLPHLKAEPTLHGQANRDVTSVQQHPPEVCPPSQRVQRPRRITR